MSQDFKALWDFVLGCKKFVKKHEPNLCGKYVTHGDDL